MTRCSTRAVNSVLTYDAIERFQADMAAIETPNMRWLRQNGQAINRAYAEMMEERNAITRCKGAHPHV